MLLVIAALLTLPHSERYRYRDAVIVVCCIVCAVCTASVNAGYSTAVHAKIGVQNTDTRADARGPRSLHPEEA